MWLNCVEVCVCGGRGIEKIERIEKRSQGAQAGLRLKADLELVSLLPPFPEHSKALGLQVCTTMPSLCGAGDRDQGLMHARQALPNSVTHPVPKLNVN